MSRGKDSQAMMFDYLMQAVLVAMITMGNEPIEVIIAMTPPWF